jgi:hypothetical protein
LHRRQRGRFRGSDLGLDRSWTLLARFPAHDAGALYFFTL